MEVEMAFIQVLVWAHNLFQDVLLIELAFFQNKCFLLRGW